MGATRALVKGMGVTRASAKEMSVKATTMPIARANGGTMRALEIDGDKAITASDRVNGSVEVDRVVQLARALLKPHESNNSVDGISVEQRERWWQLRGDRTRALVAIASRLGESVNCRSEGQRTAIASKSITLEVKTRASLSLIHI